MDPLAPDPNRSEHLQLELQIRMLQQKIKLVWAAELADLLQLQRHPLGLLGSLGGLNGLHGPGDRGVLWPPPHRNARERARPGS